MSWILGVVSNNLTSTLRARVSAVHDPPLHIVSDAQIYLAAGGLQTTMLFDHPADTPPLIILGCGVRHESGKTVGMTVHHWRSALVGAQPDFRGIDGHFLAISPRRGEVYCWSDPLGLRRLFAINREGATFFSSRIDLLATVVGGLSLSPKNFVGHWLTFNQMSYESFHEGVFRTGPGSTMVLSSAAVRIRNRVYLPDSTPVQPSAFTDLLKRHLAFEPVTGGGMAFGLSGGLDSRLLLSLLLGQGKPFSLYALGNESEPDCVTARSIARDLSLKQTMLGEEVPSAEVCLERLRRYAARTFAFSPASAFHKLGVFGKLHESGSFVVDGGMGEIVRRQFLNRLRVRGKRFLDTARPVDLFRHLRVGVPPIFKREIIEEMEKGALNDIEAAMEQLPATRSHHDLLDTLIVRYRYPNYAGIEQSRMDEEVLSLTPFCQPSVIDSVFGLAASHKEGGRLFRRLIRSGNATLTRYPLVKGGTIYPFRLSPFSSWLWTTVQKKIGWSYEDPAPSIILKTLGPYIRDQARTTGVRTYEHYDHATILRSVDSYFDGDLSKADFVDRWLSFEVWRQMTGGVGH